MFAVFEIYVVKDLRFLAPKIPYYVTYDLNFDIEIVKISSSASYINNKLLTGKMICLKDF